MYLFDLQRHEILGSVYNHVLKGYIPAEGVWCVILKARVSSQLTTLKRIQTQQNPQQIETRSDY